jgi:hypothetical protein
MPTNATAVVARALADAEALLRTSGATSGVARVHTALHGYLISVCDDFEISYPERPTMPQLLRRLRQEHPAFYDLGPRANDIERVLNSSATILDALNPLRNQASVAHPNPRLLDTDEAWLVINVARSLLAYFGAKLA